MAFEVFDDVAFFYMITSIVAMAVIPWTFFKFGKLPASKAQEHKQDDKACDCDSCKNKQQLLQAQKPKGFKQYFTLSNVIFVLLWVWFIYLLVQIPSFNQTELASFQPYQILGLDKDANVDDIKKAFRKLSLKYHPDKNQDDDEAHQKFILINKAYQTLTDPAAKDNIEKYGNPDGYQGVSVTIGLPSFLTKKENEIRVLFMYFLLIIVLPPIAVFIWWNKAKDYHDSGIMHRTFAFYWQNLSESASLKPLVKILSLSGEFQPLESSAKNPEVLKSIGLLKQELKESDVLSIVKLKFGEDWFYAHKATVLFHSYLQRLDIPPILQQDLLFILKDVHKLLTCMLDVAMTKESVAPVISVINLMQCMTQAVWTDDSPLLQIPYFTHEEVRKANKNKIHSIAAFRKSEKKQKLFEDFDETKWQRINKMLDMIPEVDMKYKYEVEDEKDIREGDVISLKITLQRVNFDPARPEGIIATASEVLSTSQQESSPSSTSPTADATAVVQQAPPQKQKLTKADKHNRFKRVSKHPSPTSSSSTTKKEEAEDEDHNGEKTTSEIEMSTSSSPEQQNDANQKDETDEEDDDIDNFLEKIPVPEKKKRVNENDAPMVHAPHFPYPKREKWFVFLIQYSDKKPRIIGTERIYDLSETATIDMKFPAPEAKKNMAYSYVLVAMCDSYIGVDRVANFKINVGERKEIIKDEKEEEEIRKLLSDDDEVNDEDYDAKWYYLGFASFLELVVNAIALALLIVFLFNFLMSRGYWHKYIEPTASATLGLLKPVIDVVSPFVSPVLAPVTPYLAASWAWLSDKLHAPPPKESHPRASRKSRSRRSRSSEDDDSSDKTTGGKRRKPRQDFYDDDDEDQHEPEFDFDVEPELYEEEESTESTESSSTQSQE